MKWQIGLAALVLALTGCGGDDDEEPAAGPGAAESALPTPEGTSSDRSFDEAAASEAARGALLTISDFPSGWSTSEPDPETPEDEQFGAQLETCLGVPAGLLGDDREGSVSEDSLDFNSPDDIITVGSSVAIAQPGAMAEFFDVISGDKLAPCLAETMDSAVRAELEKNEDAALEDVTFDEAQVGQLSLPTFGDESVPLRATLSVSAAGLSFDVIIDLLFIRDGNNGAFLTFEGAGSAVPAELEEKYAGIVESRLAELADRSA